MKRHLNDRDGARLDDQLAAFTDEVLTRAGPAGTSAHPELDGMEQTVLRLHRTFPRFQPTQAAAARMESKISVHAKDALRKASPRWHSQQSRRRLLFAFAASLAAVSLLIILPSLTSNMGSVTAAALRPTYVGLAAAAVGGIVLLALWLRGRK